MTQKDEFDGALHVPARRIPVPKHLSLQAQALLRMPVLEATPAYPALDDREGWRKHLGTPNEAFLQMVAAYSAGVVADVRELREGEALAYEVTPAGLDRNDRRIYLDIHGGALIEGGGAICRMLAVGRAGRLGARVVTVDYRMPPDHPFPAGLDDCLAVYRGLLRDHSPKEIMVGGASAGGNIAAAMVLKARDAGLPLPAGAVLLSPEVDLTESGDSFRTNMGVDRVLRTSLMQPNLLYAAGEDLTHPYVSPLFGDFTNGFPPTLLTAGTRDLFLSNAVRMHRALRNAGVNAELHVVEALSHGTFAGAPEDAEIDREVRAFCEKRWLRQMA